MQFSERRSFFKWLSGSIIAGSVCLRVALALQGGQYFFGDEGRYDRGIQLYLALVGGQFPGVREILAMPEHALFPWVGMITTAIQQALATLSGSGDWTNHPERIAFTISYGAAALGLLSALNLWLVHRIALASGAGGAEAGWALALMAAANSGFYFSRHLLPYDCAISVMLLALLIGMRFPSSGRTVVCGAIAGTVYHLYNGYWFVVPLCALLHTVSHWNHPRRKLRIALYVTGVFAALTVPIMIGGLAGGARYFQLMGAFSRSVTQGVFSEGWSLPWEYFWHAEGTFGAAILALVVFTVAGARRTETPVPARTKAALAGLAGAYFLLILTSNGLERFVVYARTLKPLLPGFCLLGGWAIARLLSRQPSLRIIAVGSVIVAGATNFSPHFFQVFPREVEIAVLRSWGNPKRSLSVAGSLYIPLSQPVARPDLALVNAQLLYPIRDALPYPAGITLLRAEHPLVYKPFQYESHSPRERAILRTHDISIRLIKLSDPATVPNDPPADLRYRNEDRPSGY